MGRTRKPHTPATPDPEAVAALEALYAQLPALRCKGACADSCVAGLGMTPLEHQRVAAAGVPIPLREGNPGPQRGTRCPALSAIDTCRVYEVRPMICRLFGLISAMRCEAGCVPEGGWLDDRQAMALMVEVMVVGGQITRQHAVRMMRRYDQQAATGRMADVMRGVITGPDGSRTRC